MSQDWSGNSQTAFSIIGASNHSDETRQDNDYYATDPIAMELLLQYETFSKNVWECAVGEGHLANVLASHGYNVKMTDLIYRGIGIGDIDFLSEISMFDGDIVTNPPYKYAQEFVEKAFSLIYDNHKIAMFLKLTFLEGQKRRKLFDDHPPKIIYVFSKRMRCARNGNFDVMPSSAISYAWFIWQKGFSGNPIVKWI